MKVVCDIEGNSLTRPTSIWVIVCYDIETGEIHVFRNLTDDTSEKERFLQFASGVSHWIGHNFLDYDYPVLHDLLGLDVEDIPTKTTDTLIISRLVNYSRDSGHSLESYGLEFGLPKGNNSSTGFFSRYSLELETYCIQDVKITYRVYLKYLKYIALEEHKESITLEHCFQYYVVNTLHTNGFKFNVSKAKDLLKNVTSQLDVLDKEIGAVFPPKLKLIREITPKVTKHGTLSLQDFRWVPAKDGIRDLSDYNGGPFSRCSWEQFNPSSHKQLIEVLHAAGWKPTDKTKTHIDCEREITRLRYSKQGDKSLDLAELKDKLVGYSKSGWKINETNLATLPDTAPEAAKHLAKRILLESRRRTLTEWLGLVDDDGRIRGRFYGLGAWTHRMAHQQPNTANIPNEFDTNGNVKLLGKEMRQLWVAPRNRLLVGVDAEGIQLRIFAHYIDDKEFTDALVKGRKSDRSDPHSLNQRIIGSVCKTRQAAKRFIYALLLGAGIKKLSEILECSDERADEALDRLMERYRGFAKLKKEVIPKDGRRGWFIGLDGRKVAIPGGTPSERSHLAMSGYLQNGEAIVMKMATLQWMKEVENEYPRQTKIVNFVHDEWQTETPNNMEKALWVAEAQARALRDVGKKLNLKCPLEGSYYNDDHHDYTIGTNWYQTH